MKLPVNYGTFLHHVAVPAKLCICACVLVYVSTWLRMYIQAVWCVYFLLEQQCEEDLMFLLDLAANDTNLLVRLISVKTGII